LSYKTPTNQYAIRGSVLIAWSATPCGSSRPRHYADNQAYHSNVQLLTHLTPNLSRKRYNIALMDKWTRSLPT